MAYDIAALDELINLIQKRPLVGPPAYYGPRDFMGNPLAPSAECLIRRDERDRLTAVEGMALEEIQAMAATSRATTVPLGRDVSDGGQG